MNKFQIGILILVLLIFSALRFYNLDKTISFGWDQEQYSNQIKGVVKAHEFTLLGPRANNDSGFFLAPYFMYILVPFYAVTKLNPIALVPFLILFNLFFFFWSFRVLKRVFSLPHPLWFLFFWAINALLQKYDSTPWWPLFIPLGIISTWYFLHEITKKPSEAKNWLFLGLSLGFFMNMHFQFIFGVLYSLVFLLLLFLKTKFEFKKAGLAALGFVLLFTPLLLFDLRHNFLNLKLFLNFFSNNSSPVTRDLLSWIPTLQNSVAPFTYIKSPLAVIIFYILLITASIMLIRKSRGFDTFFFKSNLCLFLLFPVFFIIYGQPPSEYYFIFLYPFIIITLVHFFIQFKKSDLLFGLAAFLLIINFQPLLTNLKTDPLGLYWKSKVVKELKKRLDKKVFSLSFDGVPSTDTGFRYLFFVYGLVPTSDPTVPHVRVRQPALSEKTKFGVYGLEIPPTLSSK